MKYLKIVTAIFMLGLHSLAYSETFIVDSVEDIDDLRNYQNGDSSNSLRKCIRLSNENRGLDSIFFAFDIQYPYALYLNNNLPVIIDPVYINGFVGNNGIASNPYITIGGTSVFGAISPISSIFKLNSSASGSTICGLSFCRTTGDAIQLLNTAYCLVYGCWIGVLDFERLAPSNQYKIGGNGIFLYGVHHCSIGIGDSIPNIISDCGENGIHIDSSSAVSIVGNRLGTDIEGRISRGNILSGVYLTQSNGVTVGGIALGSGNLISGNVLHGITLENKSDSFLIASNLIGTTLKGDSVLPNQQNGIDVLDCSYGTIGLPNRVFSNLISGNAGDGIAIHSSLYIGSQSGFHSISANVIGLNKNADHVVPNGENGIVISNYSIGNRIGGTISGAGNLISGNFKDGILIENNSRYTIIHGNIIGTNTLAVEDLGNQGHGIHIIHGSTHNEIGGFGKESENVISGNRLDGVNIYYASNWNIVRRNKIGVDRLGLRKIGNYDSGVSLTEANFNTIGGSNFEDRNVISGNRNFGIWSNNVTGNLIAFNFIGTDSTGINAIGNNRNGIDFQGISKNINIKSNVVSGNLQGGLNLLNVSESNITGNFIGVGLNGSNELANHGNGVLLFHSQNNTIGGIGIQHRNVISGNLSHGIALQGGSSYNIIQGNFIGTDSSATICIGNGASGIILDDAGTGGNNNFNLIGGQMDGQGNVISCSQDDGINIEISSSNTIFGNFIGTDRRGQNYHVLGNHGNGIYSGSYWVGNNNYTVIGGIGNGMPNSIAGNHSDGILLADWWGGGNNFNPIRGNKIFCNRLLGIELISIGNVAQQNKGILPPTITRSENNAVFGTGVNGNTIDVYRNLSDGPGCGCQGEVYLGSTTVQNGSWVLNHNLNLNPTEGNKITATQTDNDNNTSQFSTCLMPLSVVDIFLSVENNSDSVHIQFDVSNVRYIQKFRIQKSLDGSKFENLIELSPKHTDKSQSYLYTDLPLNSSEIYYKIEAIEWDGKKFYSNVVKTKLNAEAKTLVFPNPIDRNTTLNVYTAEKHSTFIIRNLNGHKVIELACLMVGNNRLDVSMLPPGIYIIEYLQSESITQQKLIIE